MRTCALDKSSIGRVTLSLALTGVVVFSSRLHLNDEQRVYKERFEEKKREEAKKRARSDKAEQKMVRQQGGREDFYVGWV